ncbi:TlpA family protein disulfide reductase [Urechidicola vernalis]|uniref:TlpA disulfide reductase family protein n=1 Tax=Urechidicola vernalis TaxID=3075600 RepID=A0ABU2Y6H8_9FLAO|nr:TlpA disulfide reductase family protein [Urechidicola sp. P050]MDT0552658.1 TlpA disulfide reductase family protein [Urechidicola sp. P050]
MNKFLLIIAAFVLSVGCKNPKGFVTLSGKIENAETVNITISSKTFSKDIKLENDGSFKDTLKVETGVYTLTDGRNKTILFLTNGYDLKVNANISDFTNATFEGKGKESNNYIKNRIAFSKNELSDPNTYFSLERPEFEQRMKALKEHLSSISKNKVDTVLINQIVSEDERLFAYLEKNYEVKYVAAVKFKKGNPSPKFTNFENYNGGSTSLDDLKGKFVYIDVWATWCGPCKQQIPYLKQVEKEYEHKNIAFVSISTDRANKYDAWRKMIADKEMGGIQLYAGTDYSFSQEYQINAIPRFILIDPEGNIVDANAPRPSDPRLKELFNSLNI